MLLLHFEIIRLVVNELFVYRLNNKEIKDFIFSCHNLIRLSADVEFISFYLFAMLFCGHMYYTAY